MIMEKRCPYCKGQGTVPDPNGVLSPRAACPVCQGRGHNLVPRDAEHCGFCHANGKIETYDGIIQVCPDCGGIGYRW